jgi:hypothetical protein
MCQERDQAVPEFINIFHTLHSKLGIKDSEQHMVLQYHDSLCIDTSRPKWNLCTSCPWAQPTDMSSKSSRISNKRCDNLGLRTPHIKSQEMANPTHRINHRSKMDSINTTNPSHKKRSTPERQRNIPRSGETSIRSLGITLLTVTQRICWWPN